MRLPILLVFLLLNAFNNISSQELRLKNNYFDIIFSKTGIIKSFNSQGNFIEFRTDNQYAGPSIVYNNDVIMMNLSQQHTDKLEFTGETKALLYTMSYSFYGKSVAIQIKVRNKSAETLQVDKLMLQVGIDTEMDKYPHWNKVYFPTMMRCEKNFFWGYFMNPSGNILTMVSPDPVASWNHSYKTGGHRIFTTNLDLMHRLPLPDRHPQNMHTIKPDEEKSWTIYLQPASDLNNVKPIISELSKAVILDAPQYTITENESFSISAFGDVISMQITTPDNKLLNLKPATQLSFNPRNGVGKYKLIAESSDGKITEAVLSVRKPWSWYLQQARNNAIIQEQKGGSHAESWYGFFSIFLAQKYFDDEQLLQKSLEKFNEVYPLMYKADGTPLSRILWDNWDIINRIQNTAVMASLLADIYSVLNDTTYLAQAATMCDFLLKNQDEKGAYRNGHTHYTSVVYIAKSVLEVCEQEKMLARENNIWQQRYERHFNSARKAIDELTSSRDNIETEGEITYEDGMISCSYSQIAMLALLTPDKVQQDRYIESAEYLRKGHQSLSQLLIPDARMNGGSLRYWESQYDILSYANMMSSPHGWSAWRIYGLYYLYQLTGNVSLLDQIFNALGACVQLIDENTGELRWAFCVDPYLTGNPALENSNNKFSHDQMKNGNMLVKDPLFTQRENRGIRINSPVGEQYINMISGWYKAKPDTWVTGYWEPDGGSCDNDVHEIFKCLEETALTNSFVAELSNGSIKGYNCNIKVEGNLIDITPYEKTVNRVHLNLRQNVKVKIHFKNKDVEDEIKSGEMKWITTVLN